MPWFSDQTYAATDQNRRRTAAILAVSLVPFLVLTGIHWSVPPAVASGDWAHYLLHAKALLEGRPYGATGYIYTPLNSLVGPPVQPPGLPLTLLPLVAIGGVNSVLIKLLSVGSAVAFLWFAGLSLSRHGNVWCAAASVAITGIALESTYATAAIGSDLGFCALIWMVIALMDADGPLTARRVAAATLAGGLAMLYRLAAVALIPALVLYTLVNWSRTKARPLVPVAVWTVLAVLTILVLTGVPSSAGLHDIERQVSLGGLSLKFGQYKLGFFSSVLYPFGVNFVNDVYHLIAAVLATVGAVLIAREWRRRYIAAFVFSYAVMLLLVRIHEPRYVWVLYPLFAYAMLYGALNVVRRLMPRAGAVGVSRAVLGAAGAVCVLAAIQLLRAPGYPTLLGNPDVQALFAELRRQPIGMRVAFTNPRVLTLETGIPSMPLFSRPDSVALAELRLRRITHVITDTLGIQVRSTERFKALARTRPELFRPVYRNPSLVLYQLDWTSYEADGRPRAPRDTLP